MNHYTTHCASAEPITAESIHTALSEAVIKERGEVHANVLVVVQNHAGLEQYRRNGKFFADLPGGVKCWRVDTEGVGVFTRRVLVGQDSYAGFKYSLPKGALNADEFYAANPALYQGRVERNAVREGLCRETETRKEIAEKLEAVRVAMLALDSAYAQANVLLDKMADGFRLRAELFEMVGNVRPRY